MPDDTHRPSGTGPLNYALLAQENERRYGTDIGRIGTMLLAERYDDRTHFIYELLQNAEDALRRRPGWTGRRSVCFDLSESFLRVSHFGKPFDEPDVRGICGINESTKNLTAIGRFGIGFKSVYALSNRPEIHSGLEDFAIESFVRPIAVAPVERDPDETLIEIPLRSAGDLQVIANGLASLGPNALLFLREVDEIEWSVQGGPSGLYLRGWPIEQDDTVRQIKVIGQKGEETEIEEDWLLFSRPMQDAAGHHVGFIEIAFNLEGDGPETRRRLRSVPRSPLNVYFPTVVETHLGFLLQGPLRTTPSRDNVPRVDE